MCGICGVLRLDDEPENLAGDLIGRMTDSLAHRGPDDRGTWNDERIALGSRRLAVIDLSAAGHMPMANEDATVQLSYNGEVYNFEELKSRFKLVEKGHRFRSRTDTEVLVHLYEEIGSDMFAELNGMFAIAIWDSRRQELHLARDRYGIKPLFYHRDSHLFRFGSEIKAILVDERVPRQPSLQALSDYLAFDYIPGAQTAFAGILEVPPSHYMTVRAGEPCELVRYWDLPFDIDDSITEDAAVGGALELMDRAVERRLIADVPIGVLLSGGMDSSTVLALMHRHTREPIRTYSVGFEDPTFNELPYARVMAKEFGTIHREIVVTPQVVRDLFPEYLRFIDEPYADGSAIPTYCVCQLAKDEVVVVLSGEGGDEAFAGYDTYAAYKASLMFQYVPRWLRRRMIAPIVNALPVSDKKLSLEFRMKRFLAGQDLHPAEAHMWWRIVLTNPQRTKVLSARVLKEEEMLPPERHFRSVFEQSPASENLNRLLHIDSAVFLPDDLMIKNDRMSMAHSLEARVPMTDPDLTEFLSRVPLRLKYPRLRKKHLMRKAMVGTLPRSILNKKKVGLEMPYSRWFKDELRDLMLEYLDPDRAAQTGLFSPSGIRALVDEHLENRVDHGRALWGLVNYMAWFERYI